MFNISYRKVGGLRFLKLGRLTFMACVSRQFKPLNAGSALNAASRRHSQRVNPVSAPLLLTYSGE
jgi:hypothetical protein